MGDVVLVTGGAGYVGSHLTRRLLARGFKVRILDNFVYGAHGLSELAGHPDLELISGDICDQAVLDRAFRDVDAVVALAALVGDAACDLRPERALAINFESTRQTIAACGRAGVRRLVFASSCSVYGANGSGWLHEDSYLNPVSLYARTRLMSEELLLRDADGLEVFIMRLATICGASPRMRFDLMVNTMTASAVVNGTVRVSGGEQWRPHLHVQDAADGFVVALEAPAEKAGIYNLGSDAENFTIGEVGRKVVARVSGTALCDQGDNGDARSYRVSFERVRSELAFRAKRTVDDAIDEVASLLKSGAVRNHTDEQFHNARWLHSWWARQGAA